MPNPDAPIAGEPTQVPTHPFDFMAATIRDHERLVKRLREELGQAERELQDYRVQFNEFCQRALQ